MILRAIAKSVEGIIGSGIGFVLFMQPRGQIDIDYISNCDRSDVIVTLEDWLARQAGKVVASSDQTSVEVDNRLGLERMCVDIGTAIKNVPNVEVALFLMDFGDHGNLAYYSSTADMYWRIKHWVALKKNPS